MIPPVQSARTSLAILLAIFASSLHAQSQPTNTTPLILSPADSGTLNSGNVIVGQPAIQWYKVAQAYHTLTVATSAPFAAILVEDIGFGHGQPAASFFSTTTTGTCFNCWLGVRFLPPEIGFQTATLTFASPSFGTSPSLTLTGTGTPATGLLLTPVTQDFGAIPINSSSTPSLFTLTNLTGASITVAPPTLTGDFVLSTVPTGGASCGGTLANSVSCFIPITLAPTTTGLQTGTLTLQSTATVATAALTGLGLSDPGLALNPSALIFNSVPGATATQQSITLTNTSTSAEQIGPPTTSTADFSTSNTCATLAPNGTCSIAVTFIPTTAAVPAAATLNIPVATTLFTVPLTGTYSTQDTGLQIIPNDPQFGPQSVGTLSPPRQFTINNLTAKYIALTLDLPRQFVLTSPPCATLAPNAACTFSVSFLPLTNGDITGTLFARAIPNDGSAALNGIGYVEGYGLATGTLSITGPLQPRSVLDFGQLASSQSAQRILTLTNSSVAAPLNLRRITSQWPYLATSTCGPALAPAASCTVTLNYTPINQVAANASPPPSATDTTLLTIESDAASSPDLINLTGTSTPIIVTSPSNAAAQPILTTSQNSLAFANSTSLQTATLSNTGTTNLNVSALQSTPDFTLTSDCSTIAANATCNLSVSFTPQNATGPITSLGAVEISSNASTPLEFISLIGTLSSAPLTTSPTSLDFGSIALNSSATLRLQLTNPGGAPATLLNLSTTGDYAVTSSTCPAASIIPAASTCTLQLTFNPTQTGTLAGTLSVVSSTTSQPLTIPLNGVAYIPASFALTVNGTTAASATVNSGSSATYVLSVTQLNNFAGTVALVCTPIAPSGNATCSITPASVALAASTHTQTAVATITTTSIIGRNSQHPAHTLLVPDAIALCLIFPAIFYRIGRAHAILCAAIASIALLSTLACGGSQVIPLPHAAPGSYQYQVTATSTVAVTPLTQTVTLNLTVQ